MNIALVGFPAAGKKTLFSLLTHRTIPPGRRENEPLEGRAAVRDPRVNAIAAIAKPERMKYAETVFVLCPDVQVGAQERERPWVEAARRSDLLCPVVRAFTDPSIYHPAGSVNAARDQADLRMEILLTDLELIEKRLERMSKEKRGGQTPAQVAEEQALGKCKAAIEREQWPTETLLEPPELQAVRSLGLLTLKPLLWTQNVDEKDVKEEGSDPLTIACKIEQEIMGVEDVEERNAFLRELGLVSSGVDRMNRAAYDALGLMSFYTMGEDEVRAWTIRKGTPAPAAAGKIHTDIERGFIRVEIIKYDDLMAAGSEATIRQHGKLQVKGKDYVIQDGDICCFRFNV
jgi:hypothetical protein